MDGADQPAIAHLGHDVLHTLEGLVGAGVVIQEKQYAGNHLDPEEKKGDAAEEIPVRQAVNGDGLVAKWGDQVVQMKPFIKPAIDSGDHGQASRLRVTTISSPRRWTSYASSGLGGGPEMFRPSMP